MSSSPSPGLPNYAVVFNGTGNNKGVWKDSNYVYSSNYTDGIQVDTFNGSSFTKIDSDNFKDAVNVWGVGRK